MWTPVPSDLVGAWILAERLSAVRPANGLSLSRHVPSLSGSATRRVAQNEARKRRANVRHVVGCCEELARPLLLRCKWRELFRQKFARFPVQVSPTPENVKLSFPQNVRTLLPSERAEYF